jgi:FixJ family two-component response regulator
MNEPTVYIVDDDPDMRDSLGWLLETVGLRAIAYASAEEFARGYYEDGPACLVLDVRMPGWSGLDLFESLCAGGSSMPVLFITAHADVPMAVRAMKSGAAEFLEKPFNGQVLLEKIQQALRESAARLERRAARESLRARFDSLTDKEREVLALVRSGMPNKEIAARLDITPRAVEMRRSGLMRKLGVDSLPELLRIALAYDEAAGPAGPSDRAAEAPDRAASSARNLRGDA